MAVDEEAPEGGEGGKKEKPAGGNPLVKIIVYVALALVLMAVSAYVAATVAKKEGAPPPDTANGGHPPDEVGNERTAPLRIMPVGEIITQIRGKSLKMTIELAFDAEKHKLLETELTNRKPQLLDMFHHIVFTATAPELAPENLSGLKGKMLEQVNDVLKDGRITAVYITGYIYTG